MKKNYYLCIDTRQTGIINIKYAFKITEFISYIKKNAVKLFEQQWLQNSIILIDSKIIMNLFNIIFNITSPIAPIYLVNSINDMKFIDEICKQYNSNDINLNKFTQINNILDNNKIYYKFIAP